MYFEPRFSNSRRYWYMQGKDNTQNQIKYLFFENSSWTERPQTSPHPPKPQDGTILVCRNCLNAIQMNILGRVITSPLSDINGVRLLPLRAKFAFLSVESVFMPLLSVKRCYGESLNCQLLCSYFHHQPAKLLSIINNPDENTQFEPVTYTE
jgi:hypothetical protein